MGRGDKKTKKGKIFKGSFGKTRPANKAVVKTKEEAPKKKQAGGRGQRAVGSRQQAHESSIRDFKYHLN